MSGKRAATRLVAAVILFVAGAVVLALTERGREVESLGAGWVRRHVHGWDFVSYPLIFAGIGFLLSWSKARQQVTTKEGTGVTSDTNPDPSRPDARG